MKNNQILKDNPVPLWQRVVGYTNIFLLAFYSVLPGSVAAYEILSDSYITTEINNNPQFDLSNNRDFLAEKSYYVTDTTSTNAQTIESFHEKLKAHRKSSLPAPTMIPIMTGDMTIIFPHYPLAKRVGDNFVQSRFIRSQIYNQLNRNLLNDGFTNEAAQINELYNKAYSFSNTSTKKFGDTLTAADIAEFAHNFIWPELRTINNQSVLVPVVHLTDDTINEQKIVNHTVEFLGDTTTFNSVTINTSTVNLRRNTLLKVVNDLNINEGGALKASHDLNVLVGGTLQNISGEISAQGNVNIIAGQYIQKTMVHRFQTPTTQGTRLGQIASVNAPNGNISIKTSGDITIAGGTVSGNNITLNADGNIRLTSQQTTHVRNEVINGWTENTSIVEQLHSELSAEQSVSLIAAGAIEIDTTNIHADKGTIEILAGNGIYIADSQNQFQSQRHGKWGRTTKQEREFQTIAMRSALSAGQGIVIATDFGDINLRATQLTSTTGTNIAAHNGAVNFLLTKEQDNYFYNEVVEGFWKIKTTTQQDDVETAVYNEIIGGVKVHATRGMTLELAQYEDGDVATGINTETSRISAELKTLKESLEYAKENGLSTTSLEVQIQEKSDELLQEQLSQLADTESLGWMQTLHNDPEYTDNFNLVYKELVELHKFDKTSTLSPAAMAIIAIAMAVAMGPAGFGAIGSGGTIAVQSTTLTAALQAGALSIATQTATSLASGVGLEETIKAQFHSDNIKATATAMATAGAMEYFNGHLQFLDGGKPSAEWGSLSPTQQTNFIINQGTQAIGNAVIRTGISTIINGGDLGEFEDAFVQTLAQSAVNALGKHMAETIRDANLDTSLLYISHAAAGCVFGAASARVSGSEDIARNCGGGATGAVVGEYVGRVSAEKLATNLATVQKQLNQDIQFIEDGTLTIEDARVHSNLLFNDLANARAAGIDLSKLAAGLSALLLGTNVNIAANAGENSSENNAFGSIWKVIKAGGSASLALLNVYDKVDKGQTLYALGTALAEGNKAEAEAILQDLAKDGIIDLTISALIPQSDKLKAAIRKLREDGFHNYADDLLHYAEAAPGGNLNSTLQPGKFSVTHSDVPVATNAWTEGVEQSKLFSGRSNERSDLRKNFNDIDSDLLDKDAHHIIPWQLRDHPLISELQYDMNDLFNGILLPRNSKNLTIDTFDPCDGCAHGVHPSYNNAMEDLLDELNDLNIPLTQKSDVLIEMVQRARTNLNSGTPPLMNKYDPLKDSEALVKSWDEVLRPAIDKVKNND